MSAPPIASTKNTAEPIKNLVATPIPDFLFCNGISLPCPPVASAEEGHAIGACASLGVSGARTSCMPFCLRGESESLRWFTTLSSCDIKISITPHKKKKPRPVRGAAPEYPGFGCDITAAEEQQ